VLTLVLGGLSSGKSGFAVTLAQRSGGRVLFVATGLASDAEMEARIAAHRRERPPDWGLVEAPTRLADAAEQAATYDVVLVDAVDAWLANRLEDRGGAEAEWDGEQRAAVEADCTEDLAALRRQSRTLICVSSEVGLSLVPPTRYGRAFADLLGRCNQRLARDANEAYLVVAGRALPLSSDAGG
jgi:adenosylcobinamide kinase/adenosylcobinamide-phosphate guanylyltransferase